MPTKVGLIEKTVKVVIVCIEKSQLNQLYLFISQQFV